MKLVSVIIPVYNTGKYLNKCLGSIVNQTYSNLEIIVINDGSDDNSLDIINYFSKNHKNIKVINNDINLGVAEARNLGLKNANGDFIYFMDSDDWVDNSIIEKLVSITDKYGVKIAKCNFTSVLNLYKHKHGINNSKEEVMNFSLYPKLLYKESGALWDKLFDHSLIGDLRFPKGLIWEDTALNHPILTKAKRIVRINEPLYFYRRHPSSITFSSKINPNDKIFDILKICDLIRENCKTIGTYSEFEDVIEEIIRSKKIMLLMECVTWHGICYEDRLKIINHIYNYLGQFDDIDNFASWEPIKNRMDENIIYKLRVKLLLKEIEMSKKYETDTDNHLKEAQKIISKYKK